MLIFRIFNCVILTFVIFTFLKFSNIWFSKINKSYLVAINATSTLQSDFLNVKYVT